MKLKCKKCGRVWEYNGNNTVYATCTNCHANVKIRGAKC